MNGTFTEDLASAAANCSYFISHGDTFSNNHADIAGGILYSSDLLSTRMACGTDATVSAFDPQCHAWDDNNNTVGDLTIPISSVVGIGGYGSKAAFDPARIQLGSASSVSIDYFSDGMTKLPVPEISVIDQAGSTVTTGTAV